ncbi:hypothetical protein [Streptomyces monomycini]|uniref:hypothetical protein n=1 Tax=Streptomyces monomycini TaxID=371720 RepID=UPI0009988E23|nr:hypothetical protein [Streptomyces monomycini]
MSEIEILLSQAVPAVSAAVGAYGAAVLTRAEDEVAGATVRLGQRLLERLRRNNPDRPALDAAVTDLAEADDDPDAVAALRLQIRQALRDSPQLCTELAALLPVPRASTSGERTVAVVGDMTGIVSNGDGATNILRR